jgi:hypothetical protein
MNINQLPAFDRTDNPTGCCPRFQPAPWDGQELRFENKPFVRASTISLFHMPLNMGSMFSKTQAAIQQAHADGDGFLVMSHDDSAWHGSHLFAVNRDVPGADMVHLTGTFLTKVFDGPFSQARSWCDDMAALARQKGKHAETIYFFYTTCPRCAKVYGHNYVVGLAQVS